MGPPGGRASLVRFRERTDLPARLRDYVEGKRTVRVGSLRRLASSCFLLRGLRVRAGGKERGRAKMTKEPTMCLKASTLVASTGAKVAFSGQFSGGSRGPGSLQNRLGWPLCLAGGQVATGATALPTVRVRITFGSESRALCQAWQDTKSVFSSRIKRLSRHLIDNKSPDGLASMT
jgi:hypothetical protein